MVDRVISGAANVAETGWNLESPGWLRRRLLVLLVGVVLPLASSVPAAFCSQLEKAIHQYQRARRMRTELESRPEGARPISEYRKVILAFQQVYTLCPAYRQSPASLAAAATLHEEMGREFDDNRSYKASIRAYEFLIKQYPRSAFASDALFTVAEIYRSDLDQPEKARRTYREFVERYPRAPKAAEAQQRVKQIERLLARRTRGPDEIERSPDLGSTSLPPDEETETAAADAGAHRLVRVTGVRSWVGPSYTRIVIGTEDEVKFSASHLKNPDRLVFDLSGSRVSPALVGKTFPVEGGFLRQVRIAQFQPTVARAVLDVDKIDNYSVFSLPNPFRIVIDIHGTPPLPTERAARQKSTRSPSGFRGVTPTVSITTSVSPRLSPEAPPAQPGEGRTEDGGIGEATGDAESTMSGNAAPPSESGAGVASRNVSGPTTSRQPGSSVVGTEAENSSDTRTASTRRTLHEAPRKAGTDDPEFTYRPKTSREGESSLSERAASVYSGNPSPTVAAGPGTLTRALGLKIGRIVIDPGHGGHDTGTIGPHGLREKDLVLDVALRLRRLVEQKMGADAIMTRGDDTFIPLEERTAIANQKAADLFISIHANASRDQEARGIETYYLNFTSNPQALEVAARENATSEESVHQLQSLIKKIALTEKIRESEDFALQIQRQVYARVQRSGGGQEDRGVKRAPFVVLIGANMPSILAEISFLTNPRDEKLLRKPEYRQKIAEALFRGVEGYNQSLGGFRVAQRTRGPIDRVDTPVLDPSGPRSAIAQ